MKTRLVATYILIAILTFGWSFNVQLHEPSDSIAITPNRVDQIAFRSAFCGVAWPLYWLTKLRP